jgi:hypothetical protein
MNSNINKTTGRAPFDLILRFRPEMRMNIEITETKDNHNASGETPAARREIKLKKKRCESRARHVKYIANNREKVL